MNYSLKENNIRKVFQISILLKSLNAFLEIIGGILLLFTNSIIGLIVSLAQQELIEDPQDIIANTFQRHLPYFSEHSQLFAAFYLLSHGVIKMFLVVGLLRNKLWAYPSALVVFGLFILYQIYLYIYNHSFFLVLLTLFDLVVIWLIWHEYRVLKRIKINYYAS